MKRWIEGGAWRRFAALALLPGLAWAVACAPAEDGGASASAGGAAAAADSAIAADFTLNGLDGTPFQLSQSDAKLTLLDFWATWCPPCRAEVPMFKEFQETYGDRGFRIVAVSDEDAEDVAAFVEENGITYLNLIDPDQMMEDLYDIPGLPTAYLIDSEGRIVDSFFGEKPKSILQKRIEELLPA